MKLRNKPRTLAFQIISFMFIFLAIVFVTSMLVTRHLVSQVMLENARESIGNLANEKSQIIDKDLSTLTVLGWSLTDLYTESHLSDSDIDDYILHILRSFPDLASICIATNPDADQETRVYMAKAGKLETTTLTDNDYQFKDWYQIPYLTKRVYWSDPWFDSKASQRFICSYSIPVRQKGEIQGIIRMDIPMDKLRQTVLPIRVKQTGYAFLLSYNGTIVAHPADTLAMNYSIFDIAELFGNDQLRTVGKQLVNDETGFVKIDNYLDSKEVWMYYTPLQSNHWTLVIVVPNSEVFSDLSTLLLIFAISSILAFLIIAGVIYIRTLDMNEPLERLVDSIFLAGTGDLESSIQTAPSDTYEIQILNEAFERMKASLRDYIQNLKIVTEEKNRMLNEVIFASAIQRNLIPQNIEPADAAEGFSTYGILHPAGEIGGDLYDYFQIDKDHFCFGIADVEGKGIAAAMTMTMVSTLLRTIASSYLSPDLILGSLNNFLIMNNLKSNFVTITLGIIDLRNGEVTISNAGHVPLFLLTRDHKVTKFGNTHSTALGFFEDIEIGSETIQLNPGDELILITDGITEALNSQEKFFGTDGVQHILENMSSTNPGNTAQNILAGVMEFADPKMHKDDITIFVVEFVRASQ